VNIGKVDRYGRLYIPKSIRESLNLQHGGRVVIILSGGKLTLRPMTQTLLDLRGSVKVPGPQDFSAIRQEFVQRAAEPPDLRDDAERRYEQDVADRPDFD
jgi:AbrB family looped-hinge helix DNA binding protein